MGVKVQCKDGMIELGGDFNSALAMVKRIEGRKYDSTTKVWMVPVELKHFNFCGFPFNVLSGNMQGRFQSGDHHTRHGNVYSRGEWSEFQSAEAAARKVASEYAGKFVELESQYTKRLIEAGIPQKSISAVLTHRFLDMVEYGRIQFSSEERKVTVMAIYQAWETEYSNLVQAEAEARDAAREQVYGYGREY